MTCDKPNHDNNTRPSATGLQTRQLCRNKTQGCGQQKLVLISAILQKIQTARATKFPYDHYNNTRPSCIPDNYAEENTRPWQHTKQKLVLIPAIPQKIQTARAMNCLWPLQYTVQELVLSPVIYAENTNTNTKASDIHYKKWGCKICLMLIVIYFCCFMNKVLKRSFSHG